MPTTLIKIVIAVILLGGVFTYLLLTYTDVFISVPGLQYWNLQFCPRISGIVYQSAGEIWRIGPDEQARPIPVQPTLEKTGVLASPNEQHIVYTVKERDSFWSKMYVACADGSHSFPFTDWFQGRGWQWVNPDLLYYTVGSFLSNDLQNNDHRAYLLNIRTGQSQEVEKPYQYLNDARNPKTPELIAIFSRDRYDLHYHLTLVNSQTGTRIDPKDMPNNRSALDGVWSPDGERLAFSAQDSSGQPELYLIDRDGSELIQVTRLKDQFPELPIGNIAWSPDQKWIAFLASDDRETPPNVLYLVSVQERTLSNPNVKWSSTDWPVWSPDSTRIVYSSRSANGSSDIFVFSLATQKVTQLTFNGEWKDTITWP